MTTSLPHFKARPSPVRTSPPPPDIAAAAAERRRRRKQQQRRESQGAEQSEGGISEDSAQYDTPGEGMVRSARRHGGRVTRPRRFDEQVAGGFVNDGVSTADEDAVGGQADFFAVGEDPSSRDRSHPAAEAPARAGAQAAAGAAFADSPTTAESSVAPHAYGAGTTAPPSAAMGHPSPGGGRESIAAAASAIPGLAVDQPRQQTPERALGDLHEAPVGKAGAPGKEDGSGWSDQDTFSSAAPSPLVQGEGQEHPRRQAGPGDADPNSYPSRPRPPPLAPLQVGAMVSNSPSSARQEEEEEEDGREGKGHREQARAARLTPANEASGGSANVGAGKLRLSPAKTPLRQQPAHTGSGKRLGGVSAGTGGGDVEARGRADSVGRGVGSAGAGSFSSTAASSATAAVSAAARQGAPPSPSSGPGRERQGLGNLLRMGARKIGRHGGDFEALEVEAAERRAEVEELSLELEDAEDR